MTLLDPRLLPLQVLSNFLGKELLEVIGKAPSAVLEPFKPICLFRMKRFQVSLVIYLQRS